MRTGVATTSNHRILCSHTAANRDAQAELERGKGNPRKKPKAMSTDITTQADKSKPTKNKRNNPTPRSGKALPNHPWEHLRPAIKRGCAYRNLRVTRGLERIAKQWPSQQVVYFPCVSVILV